MVQTMRAPKALQKKKVYAYGPASPCSHNQLDSSSSIGSINELYENYKNEKYGELDFIKEVKRQDLDVETVLKSSLENPLTEKESEKTPTPMN